MFDLFRTQTGTRPVGRMAFRGWYLPTFCRRFNLCPGPKSTCIKWSECVSRHASHWIQGTSQLYLGTGPKCPSSWGGVKHMSKQLQWSPFELCAVCWPNFKTFFKLLKNHPPLGLRVVDDSAELKTSFSMYRSALLSFSEMYRLRWIVDIDSFIVLIASLSLYYSRMSDQMLITITREEVVEL